jgi:hypothetical protein
MAPKAGRHEGRGEEEKDPELPKAVYPARVEVVLRNAEGILPKEKDGEGRHDEGSDDPRVAVHDADGLEARHEVYDVDPGRSS